MEKPYLCGKPLLASAPLGIAFRIARRDPAQGFPAGRAFRILRRAAGFLLPLQGLSNVLRCRSINSSRRSFSVRRHSNPTNCRSSSFRGHSCFSYSRSLSVQVRGLPKSSYSRFSSVSSKRRSSRARLFGSANSCSCLDLARKKSPFVLHRVSEGCFHHPSIAAETTDDLYPSIDFERIFLRASYGKGGVGTDSLILVFCALCLGVLLPRPREKKSFACSFPSCSVLCCGQPPRVFSHLPNFRLCLLRTPRFVLPISSKRNGLGVLLPLRTVFSLCFSPPL